MKTQYGMLATCKYCEQDIQFLGGRANWRDRGANRKCTAYLDKNKGEYITPKTKHAPYFEGVAIALPGRLVA